jgi:hypothetical protein
MKKDYQLEAVYSGPVAGILQNGIILRNTVEVLEPALVSALMDSLTRNADLQVCDC